MRTLGLLGGMTWHSTIDYYRLINAGVQKRLGGSRSAPLVLVSLDFAPIEELQVKGDWGSLGVLMAEAAVKVERAGAEGLLVCANTMHRLSGDIGRAVSIPLLHIADAAAAEIKKRGFRRVGLLGTRYTMEQEFYREKLEKDHSLTVVVPEEPGRTVIHDVIYNELGRGLIREESRQAYVRIIDDLRARGAQGVVLGCTEIPLLVRPEDSPIPVFDTTKLHAAAAVEFILGA
jgi:aspartate racemase